MKFHIHSPGDPSVGIPSDEATVDLPYLKEFNYFVQENPNEPYDVAKRNYLDHIVMIKENLCEAFKQIFDDRRVWVMTDEEFKAYLKCPEYPEDDLDSDGIISPKNIQFFKR